jgi:hypothetical protein
MTAKLARLRPPHATGELNIGGRFFLPRIDGMTYVPDVEDYRLHIEAATKVGGYVRVDYPKFPPPIWSAINAMINALDGSERQEVLDALECVSQGLVADDGTPAERLYPAT